MSDRYCANFSSIFDNSHEGRLESPVKDQVRSSVFPRGEPQGQGSRLSKCLSTLFLTDVDEILLLEDSQHTARVGVDEHPVSRSKGKKSLVNTLVVKCVYNHQQYPRAQNIRFQPYPSLATIRVRMGSKMVHLERFQDLYFKDHIWAAKEVCREKVKHTKMNNFLVCGLHSKSFW